MTETTLPKRVYLATDLSARSDRALARAAALSSTWHSELFVVHAVRAAEVAHRDSLTSHVPSWRRPESWARTLESALIADLAAAGVAATPKVLIGAPAEVVQAAATQDGAGLIVLGIAKDARMDRLQLGSTVDALVRRSPVPVLNVRGRARAAYRHVVVATDFSESSLQALRLAAAWFEGAHMTLFHAHRPAGASRTAGPSADESWRAAVLKDFAAQVAQAGMTPDRAKQVDCVAESGWAEELLPDFAASKGVDLVVLGSHGRSGLSRVLLGSTAENLLHTLDCDTLVVRSD